jgi:dCTP deaminase
MILSDKQIKARCIAPRSVIETPTDPNTVRRLPGGGYQSTLLAFDSTPRERMLTEEEIAAFVPMIAPFHPESIRRVEDRETRGGELCVDPRKVISLGLTSYGYDVSLSENDVRIFTNINATEIDPKALDEACLVPATIRIAPNGAKYVSLPPHSYMLGSTNEYFRMPRDVLAICLGKSTYARAGILVNATPIEPGFEGEVVIEIANSTSLPARIYLNEGISQFLFFQGEPCEVSYADRGGKYQGQTGVTLPRM